MRNLVILASITAALSSTAASAQDYSRQRLIESVYVKYFNHVPNPQSFRLWMVKLDWVSPLEFEAEILGGPSYYNHRAHYNPVRFILAMFHDVAGIDRPNPGEVDRWLRRLSEVGSRQHVAMEFLLTYRRGAGNSVEALPIPAPSPPLQPSP